MSFSYSGGTTTPGFGGLAEFTNLRLNDGTFRPLVIPPITQTAPLRFVVTSIPRGGGKVSTPTLDAWQFDLTGFVDVTSPNDMQAAVDYLKAHVNFGLGLIGLTLNAKGWTSARTMAVRVAGQVVVDEPTDVRLKKLLRRSFTIPLIAEDPIQYAINETDNVITTSTTVTNAGTAPIPYVVRFDAVNTTFIQIADLLGNKVRLDYALTSGQYAEINTRDGSIITNTGVDLYQYVTIDDAVRYLAPGNNSFTKTSGSGGTATVKHFDGWA